MTINKQKKVVASPLHYFIDITTTDSYSSIGPTFSDKDDEEETSLKRDQQLGYHQNDNNNDVKRLETIDGILSFRRKIDNKMWFNQQQKNQSNNAFQQSNKGRNNYSVDGILIERPSDIEKFIVNGKNK